MKRKGHEKERSWDGEGKKETGEGERTQVKTGESGEIMEKTWEGGGQTEVLL